MAPTIPCTSRPVFDRSAFATFELYERQLRLIETGGIYFSTLPSESGMHVAHCLSNGLFASPPSGNARDKGWPEYSLLLAAFLPACIPSDIRKVRYGHECAQGVLAELSELLSAPNVDLSTIVLERGLRNTLLHGTDASAARARRMAQAICQKLLGPERSPPNELGAMGGPDGRELAARAIAFGTAFVAAFWGVPTSSTVCEKWLLISVGRSKSVLTLESVESSDSSPVTAENLQASRPCELSWEQRLNTSCQTLKDFSATYGEDLLLQVYRLAAQLMEHHQALPPDDHFRQTLQDVPTTDVSLFALVALKRLAACAARCVHLLRGVLATVSIEAAIGHLCVRVVAAEAFFQRFQGISTVLHASVPNGAGLSAPADKQRLPSLSHENTKRKRVCVPRTPLGYKQYRKNPIMCFYLSLGTHAGSIANALANAAMSAVGQCAPRTLIIASEQITASIERSFATYTRKRPLAAIEKEALPQLPAAMIYAAAKLPINDSLIGAILATRSTACRKARDNEVWEHSMASIFFGMYSLMSSTIRPGTDSVVGFLLANQELYVKKEWRLCEGAPTEAHSQTVPSPSSETEAAQSSVQCTERIFCTALLEHATAMSLLRCAYPTRFTTFSPPVILCAPLNGLLF